MNQLQLWTLNHPTFVAEDCDKAEYARWLGAFSIVFTINVGTE